MSILVEDVMRAMEHLAPLPLAEEWDNPGLQVGDPVAEVRGILTCLDVSEAAIAEAEQVGANLIVSHHPLIFHAQKSVRADNPLGRMMLQLIGKGIAVYSAHTNLDIAVGGVNDVLAEAVGLRKLSAFVITQQDENGHVESLGRVGTLPAPMTIQDFAAQVRAGLPCDHLRYVDAGPRPVRKVALCSGSGAEFIERAARLGADCYLTGDVRYHDAQHAAALGLHLIDAGHFATEYPIAHALKEYLQKELPDVRVYEDKMAKDFFKTL